MDAHAAPGADWPEHNDARGGNDAWRGRAVGLLDLDAFFASVEQLDHPEWRGRPVIVGGDPERRGVVSTASYEARRFGVHSAMPSAQAKRLCPDAVWTAGNFDRYREVSAQVMACIAAETPLVEQVSVDEAFFDVSPGRFAHEDPVAICRRIAANVEKLGVTCSIGLSTSKTVSKIASERNKPNGTTVVWPGTEGAFLAPLPVRAMSGVGPRTAEALERAGVRTLGELAQADPQVLAGLLGVAGPRLVERARGLDRSPVAPCDAPDDVKSVSSERTFAHDLSTREELVSALGYIAATTARRLRGKGLAGRTVTVKVTYRYGESRSARASLARPSCDERDLLQAALGVLDQLWSEGVGVRLLGVGVSNWDAGGVQPTLFDDLEADEAEQESRRRLTEATDRLRERFGDAAVMYGSELRFRDAVSNTASAHRKDG